jgi:hypothetical protein
MTKNSKPNSTESANESQWTHQHSVGPGNTKVDQQNINSGDNVFRGDSYRDTSRDEIAEDETKVTKSMGAVGAKDFSAKFNRDYDYQDHDSFEQPVKSSNRGYAPIEQQQPSEPTAESIDAENGNRNV